MLDSGSISADTDCLEAAAPPVLKRVHMRRLRDIYRSAGWPCQDVIEIELLAAGLLLRTDDGTGLAVVLRLTDAGIAALAAAVAGNRAAYSAHAALETLVAKEMHRAGRLVWRGLSLRAQVPQGPQVPQALASAAAVVSSQGQAAAKGLLPLQSALGEAFCTDAMAQETAASSAQELRWCLAKPDVYSIRNTSVAEYVHPVVHEIKVRRADLLGDLKKPDKRAAYLDMASECWYVLGRDGRGRSIADASEIPLECGVMVEQAGQLRVVRAAPRRAMSLPFVIWMSLAKANPWHPDEDDVQALLLPCHVAGD